MFTKTELINPKLSKVFIITQASIFYDLNRQVPIFIGDTMCILFFRAKFQGISPENIYRGNDHVARCCGTDQLTSFAEKLGWELSYILFFFGGVQGSRPSGNG